MFEGSDLLIGGARAQARAVLETGNGEDLVSLLPRAYQLALGGNRATGLANDLLGVMI